MTLIQRFGGALNLNLHFHMLLPDEVYVERPGGAFTLRWVKAPTSAELIVPAARVAGRMGAFLERQDLLEGDAEDTCLVDLAVDEEPMQGRLAQSITYRIARAARRAQGAYAATACLPAMKDAVRRQASSAASVCTPVERRAAMPWAHRLKRVFGIDIQTRAVCGGAMRIILHRGSSRDREDPRPPRCESGWRSGRPASAVPAPPPWPFG